MLLLGDFRGANTERARGERHGERAAAGDERELEAGKSKKKVKKSRSVLFHGSNGSFLLLPPPPPPLSSSPSLPSLPLLLEIMALRGSHLECCEFAHTRPKTATAALSSLLFTPHHSHAHALFLRAWRRVRPTRPWRGACCPRPCARRSRRRRGRGRARAPWPPPRRVAPCRRAWLRRPSRRRPL